MCLFLLFPLLLFTNFPFIKNCHRGDTKNRRLSPRRWKYLAEAMPQITHTSPRRWDFVAEVRTELHMLRRGDEKSAPRRHTCKGQVSRRVCRRGDNKLSPRRQMVFKLQFCLFCPFIRLTLFWSVWTRLELLQNALSSRICPKTLCKPSLFFSSSNFALKHKISQFKRYSGSKWTK